jgi:hypothetical protein
LCEGTQAKVWFRRQRDLDRGHVLVDFGKGLGVWRKPKGKDLHGGGGGGRWGVCLFVCVCVCVCVRFFFFFKFLALARNVNSIIRVPILVIPRW